MNVPRTGNAILLTQSETWTYAKIRPKYAGHKVFAAKIKTFQGEARCVPLLGTHCSAAWNIVLQALKHRAPSLETSCSKP